MEQLRNTAGHHVPTENFKNLPINTLKHVKIAENDFGFTIHCYYKGTEIKGGKLKGKSGVEKFVIKFKKLKLVLMKLSQ